MKTEVYSWRVSADLKTDLEREARRRKMSVSALLDLAAREWLSNTGPDQAGDEEQRRLHRAARKCFGVLASGDPYRSENAPSAIRERLQQRRER
jgi:hypothetical protein